MSRDRFARTRRSARRGRTTGFPQGGLVRGRDLRRSYRRRAAMTSASLFPDPVVRLVAGVDEAGRGRFREMVRKRQDGAPTAHIVGKKEFYFSYSIYSSINFHL